MTVWSTRSQATMVTTSLILSSPLETELLEGKYYLKHDSLSNLWRQKWQQERTGTDNVYFLTQAVWQPCLKRYSSTLVAGNARSWLCRHDCHSQTLGCKHAHTFIYTCQVHQNHTKKSSRSKRRHSPVTVIAKLDYYNLILKDRETKHMLKLKQTCLKEVVKL